MGPTTAQMEHSKCAFKCLCQKRAIWLVESENDEVMFRRTLWGPIWNRAWLVEDHPSDPGVIIADKLQQYRIYSNKRRGAYLIFRATSAALIRGRRLFEGGAYLNIVPDKFTFSIFLFNGTLSIC